VHTSQPGISKQLKLLEQQLGAVLLARSAGRIVRSTDNGEQVFEAAKRILRETEGLARMGQDFMGQESGHLTVATLHT
jgi:LysR family cys regulon transcriptional activator